MKTTLLLFIILFITIAASSQSAFVDIVSLEALEHQNELQIITNVHTGMYGASFGYEITLDGDTYNLDACYFVLGFATPRWHVDTISVPLPLPGTYNVVFRAHEDFSGTADSLSVCMDHPFDEMIIQFNLTKGFVGTTTQMKPANDFTIYPNPCDSQVNIQCLSENTETSNLQIYNSVGKLIWASTLSPCLHINTQTWQPGLYFCIQASTTGTVTRPFIKIN